LGTIYTSQATFLTPSALNFLDQPFDPVKAKLIGLVAYFVAILYNGVAAFLYCETNFAPKTGAPPHTIWDAFYFILITASTVGYGDITPKSYEAKVVVMVFIVVALSVVPGLIAGTIETIKLSRAGGGSYTQRRGVDGVVKQYLVMIGDFQSSRRVGDMLNGFFNKVNIEYALPLVVLRTFGRTKPDRVTYSPRLLLSLVVNLRSFQKAMCVSFSCRGTNHPMKSRIFWTCQCTRIGRPCSLATDWMRSIFKGVRLEMQQGSLSSQV